MLQKCYKTHNTIFMIICDMQYMVIFFAPYGRRSYQGCLSPGTDHKKGARNVSCTLAFIAVIYGYLIFA